MWMVVWWITEAIPIYITALLPLAIFPMFEITALGETSAAYADRIVFLFLGGFILAKAVEKTGLHKRFALNILNIVGTNPKNIVAAFIIVTGFLSAWISNTATAILMVPIATSIIMQIANPTEREKFGTCLMLSIAYSASLGGIATLIGTPPNAIFASIASSIQGVDIDFTEWMLVSMPISVISLTILWLYIVNVIKVGKTKDVSQVEKEKRIIVEELHRLGKMSKDEKLAACVFAATAIAWITRGLLWKDIIPTIDDTTIVIISSIVLFLLPSLSSTASSSFSSKKSKSSLFTSFSNNRLLDWDTAIKIPWGILLLIGGGLALANAFETTGLDKMIANSLSFLKEFHYITVIAIIVSIAIFSSEIMSNTATAALLIPISASLASSMSIDPLLLMAPVAIATSYGFIMPVGTPPNAIIFATGYITVYKMARIGLPLDIIGIIIVTVMSSITIPLIWQI